MYSTRIEKCIYEKVEYSTMAESYDICIFVMSEQSNNFFKIKACCYKN